MEPPAFSARLPLEPLLPPGISVAATWSEVEAPLFREEERELRFAVEKRRREFITGRACARRALAGLGLPGTVVPVDASGAPRWPAGVVGSITHCAGYRAAAVGRAADFDAIGIDAEPNLRLPQGVLGAIGLPVERERVRRLLREAPGPCWDRLLFSAKEAAYKAWYPMTGTDLGFEDAEVAFAVASGRFEVRLRVPPRSPEGESPRLAGRWNVTAGILTTVIALPTSA